MIHCKSSGVLSKSFKLSKIKLAKKANQRTWHPLHEKMEGVDTAEINLAVAVEVADDVRVLQRPHHLGFRHRFLQSCSR